MRRLFLIFLMIALSLTGYAFPTDTADTSTVQAQVAHVIDGDSIKITIYGQPYTVRYIGIDTPEIYPSEEPYGQEATLKNRELVEVQIVILEKDISETDKYGRLLRYVYVWNLFVNAEMVRSGHAKAVSYPPEKITGIHGQAN